MPTKQLIMAPQQKLTFVIQWYEWFINNTESFSGPLGETLAYLWPAILTDSYVEVYSDHPLVQILKDNGITKHNAIWDYIEITHPELNT